MRRVESIRGAPVESIPFLDCHCCAANYFPQRTLSEDCTEKREQYLRFPSLFQNYRCLLITCWPWRKKNLSAFRASVKSSFGNFFPPPSLNLDCYLLSLLDSSGQVACRGAGCQQTADIGGEEDAVQDLPGGVPQEHQGNQGWAGQGLLYFAKCSLVGGYFPYTLLLTVETSLWGVKTKCCHVREEQIFKSKTVPSCLG